VTRYLDKQQFNAESADLIVPGKLVHLAAVRDGGALSLYVDGKKVGSALFPKDQKPSADLGFTIAKGFDGEIEQIRVSKSRRYDRAFVPAAVLEADADTVALYRFDEGQGDKLTDSSGNGHHGKIVGAKWVKVR
jgi:hypothetical protein